MSNGGVPEFVDTYSDDLIYLDQAYQHLLSSPRIARQLCVAAFCRLYVVTAVNSIELMIRRWRDEYGAPLDAYLNQGGRSNEERVNTLGAAFRAEGIPVDPEIMKDYLAMKYLRNTIVHGRWFEDERAWVEQRGFARDLRHLGETHWGRVHEVTQRMMFYIALSAVGKKGARADGTEGGPRPV